MAWPKILQHALNSKLHSSQANEFSAWPSHAEDTNKLNTSSYCVINSFNKYFRIHLNTISYILLRARLHVFAFTIFHNTILPRSKRNDKFRNGGSITACCICVLRAPMDCTKQSKYEH